MAVSGVASAAPGILIFQDHSPIKRSKDISPFDIDIATPIREEYDTNGRLLPIVYSKTDPAFNSAVSSGRLGDAPEIPKLPDVFDASRRLGTEFVLAIQTSKVRRSVVAKVQLFRDRRQIWSDEVNMMVSIKESLNPADTARSIARTLVLKMNSAPFRGYPDQPKAPSPVLQPGQAPVVAKTGTGLQNGVTNIQLKKSIESLVQSGKTDNAILMLRDAVDASPLDLERRIDLIDLLSTTSPTAAAQEARRAAILMPEKIDLRVQAARAWIKAGQPDEAQKDLNEAVARDPNGTPTRLLLGELSLQQLEPAKAIGHLDEVIKQKDTGYARFLRALCRALLGGIDGMQIDIAEADKLEPGRSALENARRYAQAADVIDRSLAQDGATVRSLLTKIVVKPNDQGIKDQLEQTIRLAQSRTAFLSAIAVPSSAKVANDRRLLAHKLLAQSLLDLQSYAGTPDEDTLADARINLGEALKQSTAGRG